MGLVLLWQQDEFRAVVVLDHRHRHLYQILLILCNDRQAEVDYFIPAKEPAVPYLRERRGAAEWPANPGTREGPGPGRANVGCTALTPPPAGRLRCCR